MMNKNACFFCLVLFVFAFCFLAYSQDQEIEMNEEAPFVREQTMSQQNVTDNQTSEQEVFNPPIDYPSEGSVLLDEYTYSREKDRLVDFRNDIPDAVTGTLRGDDTK